MYKTLKQKYYKMTTVTFKEFILSFLFLNIPLFGSNESRAIQDVMKSYFACPVVQNLKTLFEEDVNNGNLVYPSTNPLCPIRSILQNTDYIPDVYYLRSTENGNFVLPDQQLWMFNDSIQITIDTREINAPFKL